MHLTLCLAALVLAMTTSAAPTDTINPPANSARSTIASGQNTNGSIFMFGSASNCRKIFNQYGACGISTYFANEVDPNMPLIALPSNYFDKYGPQDQNNRLCAKLITMTRNGVTQKAVVADVNTSDEHSIDMCLDSWQRFGGHDNDGTLLRGINWSIAG